MKVLFVDDEADVLRGLERSLRRHRHDWEMRFTGTGADALLALAEGPYDVVVSDVRMPGMDGVELLSKVQELYPTTIRIILSGHSAKDAVLRAVGPAHQYLAKPCDAEQLCATVRAAFALREVLTDERLKKLVARLTSVPSLPSLYREILAELRSEEPSIRNVAEIVSKDVAMTAKVLQLVNSAFFGLSQRVTDPARAVMHLGTETVRALALTTGVFSQLGSGGIGEGFVEALWGHSMRVASLAKGIAELEGASRDAVNACYQAGFLHDIGQLVLAANLPSDYVDALEAAHRRGVPLVEQQRVSLGANHAEVGGYLLGIWGLPDLVVQAVTFHHEPARFPAQGFTPLAAVHAADAIERHISGDSPLGGDALEVDLEYLREAGLEHRIDEWTALCRDMLAEEATT